MRAPAPRSRSRSRPRRGSGRTNRERRRSPEPLRRAGPGAGAGRRDAGIGRRALPHGSARRARRSGRAGFRYGGEEGEHRLGRRGMVVAGRRAERLPTSLTTRPTRPDPLHPPWHGWVALGLLSPWQLPRSSSDPPRATPAGGAPKLAAMIRAKRAHERSGPEDGTRGLLDRLSPRDGKKETTGSTGGPRSSRPARSTVAGSPTTRPAVPGSGRGIAGNWPPTVSPSTSRPRKEVTGRFPSSLAPPAPSAAMRRWYSTASSDPVGYWAPIPRAACRASGPLAAGAGRPVTGTAPRACRRGVAVPARTVRSGRRRDTGTSGPTWRSVGPPRGAPSRSRGPGP